LKPSGLKESPQLDSGLVLDIKAVITNPSAGSGSLYITTINFPVCLKYDAIFSCVNLIGTLFFDIATSLK
jgi:hypothetical protein